MEKISKILPPSARTQSYDNSRALPVRPGAPTLGRPMAKPIEIEDRMTLSDQMVSPIMDGDTLPSKSPAHTTYKPTGTVKSDLVKEMANQFFAHRNPKEVARQSSRTHSEELASETQSSTGSSVNPESSREASL